MTRVDAGTERFEQVELFGKPVLFTELRIDRDTVPDGLYLYELRHADEDWGEPCELARSITVNFFGSVLTSDPIQLSPEGWLPIKDDDFDYTGDPAMTARDYLTAHPPTDKDAREQERTAPQKNPARSPKKKRSEPER